MINIQKVWDRAGIELATPGSAVRLASVARHITDCAMWPVFLFVLFFNLSVEKNNVHRPIWFYLQPLSGQCDDLVFSVSLPHSNK